MIVTIDGPSGVGKSTISRLLAEELGYIYIDSGALYRGAALLAEDLPEESPQLLVDRLRKARFEFRKVGGENHLFIDGKDVEAEIRTEEMGRKASKVAKIPAVREILSRYQRELALRGDAILEGRDAGTVVCPEADVKFFLTARPEVRAERRYRQLLDKAGKNGEKPSFERVLQGIIDRDKRDRERELAPLKPAEDAVVIDTSELTIRQVVDRMLRYIEERKGRNV